MFRSINQTWSRNAVGYRRGELEEGDGVATMVATTVGGPALIIGALLYTNDGLGIAQILLIAPIAAVLGGAIVGGSARMAASTGADGAWLSYPSLGRVGSWFMSWLRLAMIALWAAVGLRLVGEWGSEAMSAGGFSVTSPLVAMAVIAGLGVLMTYLGLVRTIKVVIRRPIFWLSVILIAVLGWRLASMGGVSLTGVSGPFWPGVQRAVEMSALFVPFVQQVARRLHNDEEAVAAFGVGYTIPVVLMLLAGAVFALRVGGLPSDLTSIAAGTNGVILAIGWLVVAEADQVFASLVAAGTEAIGIVPVVPPVVVGTLSTGGVLALAFVVSDPPLAWASLATALVFPAVVIAVADFYLVKGRYYAEAETYGATAGQSAFNLVGICMWILAVFFGQMLNPLGPQAYLDLLPSFSTSGDLPWRLVMALVGGIGYVVLSRWQARRQASVFELRGV